MQRNVYLWEVQSMQDADMEELLISLSDSTRREKALRYRSAGDRIRSLCAGLLLQYACRQWKQEAPHTGTCFLFPGINEILSAAGQDREFNYYFGKNGKPYLENENLFFSLSHSGSYVLCAVSESEIGADIQEWKGIQPEKIAERFFHEQEKSAIRTLPRERQAACFYHMWTRKEAYGKLTGDGVVNAAGMNVLSEEMSNQVIWEDYPHMKDYSVSICYYSDRSKEQP